MALPVFDGAKWHIGLGPAADDLKGFQIAGAFTESLQIAPRVQEFGVTDDLVSTPSLSRWTQNDFLGGSYWWQWKAEDPATHRLSPGFVASLGGRELKTVPPIVLFDAEYQLMSAAAENMLSAQPLFLGQTADFIWLVFRNGVILRWDPETRAQGSTTEAFTLACAGIDTSQLFKSVLWLGTSAPTVKLRRLDISAGVFTALTEYTPPAGVTLPPMGINFGAIVPVVAWGSALYSAALAEVDATQPVWTKLGLLPATWRGSANLTGRTYILCSDDGGRTSIVETDGSTVNTYVEFPYHFFGRCIDTYAGRLYVGGYVQQPGRHPAYAVLWEVTGTSLRLVRSWEDFWRRNVPGFNFAGVETYPPRIDSLAVYDGLLFLGSSGVSLTAYDISTDAIYGGPLLQGISRGLDYADDTCISLYGNVGVANTYKHISFVDPTDYTVQTGDELRYGIHWIPGDGPQNLGLGVSLRTTDSVWLHDSGAVDQNGLSAHPQTDISAFATAGVYERVIPLPAAWASGSDIIEFYTVAVDSRGPNSGTGHRAALIINPRITGNGGAPLRKQIASDKDKSQVQSDVLAFGTPTLQMRLNPGYRTPLMLSNRGGLFVYHHDPYVSKEGLYRSARSGDVVAAYSSTFTSGEFGPEPSLIKRWSEAYLMTRYQVISPVVEYSTDGGLSYATATATHVTVGDVTRTVADLSSAPTSASLILRVTLGRGADVTGCGELVAFTVSFSFMDNGKRAWAFVLSGDSIVELGDESDFEQDVPAIHDQLWAWARDQTPLFFTDIDGDIHKVSLREITQSQIQIPDRLPESVGPREGHFRVTLVEA